jgi:hypothetical protein
MSCPYRARTVTGLWPGHRWRRISHAAIDEDDCAFRQRGLPGNMPDDVTDGLAGTANRSDRPRR